MAEVNDSTMERTKKRDPGKITRAIKVALVGDGTVGKTCLLMSYVCQAFMEDYVPTMFDNFSTIEEIDGELLNVILWDTAGKAKGHTHCYRQHIHSSITKRSQIPRFEPSDIYFAFCTTSYFQFSYQCLLFVLNYACHSQNFL
jgi:GTPase SAR1 family protein